MGAIRNQVLAICGIFVLGAGCETFNERADIAENARLYQSTGYSVRVPVDRGAFIAPLVDARSSAVEASGPLPVRVVSEAIWDRPLADMVGDVVLREFEESGVFADVSRDVVAEDALIVTPYLKRGFCGSEANVAFRRSLAEIELRVVVHGPGADAKSREVLLDRSFHQVATTPVEMRPTEPQFLVCVALRKSVMKMLGAIDQSNVARSAVPMDPSFVDGR